MSLQLLILQSLLYCTNTLQSTLRRKKQQNIAEIFQTIITREEVIDLAERIGKNSIREIAYFIRYINFKTIFIVVKDKRIRTITLVLILMLRIRANGFRPWQFHNDIFSNALLRMSD